MSQTPACACRLPRRRSACCGVIQMPSTDSPPSCAPSCTIGRRDQQEMRVEALGHGLGRDPVRERHHQVGGQHQVLPAHDVDERACRPSAAARGSVSTSRCAAVGIDHLLRCRAGGPAPGPPPRRSRGRPPRRTHAPAPPAPAAPARPRPRRYPPHRPCRPETPGRRRRSRSRGGAPP